MLTRRRVLELAARSAIVLAAILRREPRALAAVTAGDTVRSIRQTDATALSAMMNSCVASADAFFGKCGTWSQTWAEELIVRCPDSPVVSRNGTVVAFMEVPPIRPSVDAPELDTDARLTRRRNRTTFRVTAAGVRDDLLGPTESVAVFRTLLLRAFQRAETIGYEEVEAFAPWERHPRMARKWTDYPGCRLVAPVSRGQDGREVYWLRWRLADAIAALADEVGQGKAA
jgi:hypothetical protein